MNENKNFEKIINKIEVFEKKFKFNNQDAALMPALEEIFEFIIKQNYNQTELQRIYERLSVFKEMFENEKNKLIAENISLLEKNNQLNRYIINSNVKLAKS